MKKLHYLSFPMLLMVWCCLLFVSTKAAAQQCKTYFKYNSQEHLCPPESACLIANNVTYTFSALTGADYYLWDFGDGTSLKDSTGKVSHPYFKAGKYPVSLVAYYNTKGASPCKAISTQEIAFEFTGGPDPLPAECSALIETSTEGLTLKIWDEYLYNRNGEFKNTQAVYFWDFGDSTKSLNSETVHTYKNPGKYLVTVTKLIFTFYKSSEVCTASITVDGLSIRFPCYHKEICRKTYTKWITVGETNTIPTCGVKAQVSVNKNTINFSIPNRHIPVYRAAENDEAIRTKLVNYWSFGDGKDTVALGGTHTYAKAGKYLVVLHSAKYKSVQEFVFCYGDKFDSFVNSKIPCYYRLECCSIDSVWVEIKDNNDWKCLETTVNGMEIKTHMALAYVAVYRPGIITHRYYNFGDGTDTMGVDVATHTYAKPGTYLVSGTEVEYYSETQMMRELHPDPAIVVCCLEPYNDLSVRFSTFDCTIKEVGRISCTEWVTVNMPLGVNIYPNPANESGNVSIENAEGNVDFMVYNSAGMLVQKVENITNGTQQFETENLANGIYLYTISKDGKVLKKDKFAVHR